MAAKGQRSKDVAPSTKVTPSRNGSVLDDLMVTNSLEGQVMLSRDKSPGAKWAVLSKLVVDGQQSSPDRRNPKKHKFMAAQIIRPFQVGGREVTITFTLLKMSGVMGRRGREDCPRDDTRRMPRSRSCKRGRDSSCPGKGKPVVRCRLRTAAR